MKDLITEARELCGRATPGEWHWEGELLLTDAEQFLVLKPYYDNDTDNVSTCVMPDDAAFISRSRTLIPELCDALEKAQEQMPRWIPVTERLPTGHGYYLSVVERIAPDELGGNNTRVKIMRWLGADWRYPTHIPKWINEEITETVTHWMPLPAPPEEGAGHDED